MTTGHTLRTVALRYFTSVFVFMTRQIMVLETHDGPFINTKRNQYAWFNNSEKVKNVNTELGVVQT